MQIQLQIGEDQEDKGHMQVLRIGSDSLDEANRCQDWLHRLHKKIGGWSCKGKEF